MVRPALPAQKNNINVAFFCENAVSVTYSL